MARFDEQVAIITGAGGEVGSALAARLGGEGARIVVVDQHRPRAEAAVSMLAGSGIEARLEVGDVGDQDVAKRAVTGAIEAWGRIDILVNNAGGGRGYGNTWELPADAMDEAYRTNLRGTFLFTREAIPHMMERDYGRIVNVASIAGKEGNPGRGPYSATKAAVIGLTKSVGKELARTGIRVNCVTPAVMMTRPVTEIDPEEVEYMVSRIPMGRPGEVKETVAMVAWLASAECSFSTGAVFDISGGRATY